MYQKGNQAASEDQREGVLGSMGNWGGVPGGNNGRIKVLGCMWFEVLGGMKR